MKTIGQRTVAGASGTGMASGNLRCPGAAEVSAECAPLTLHLNANGWVPNNPRLPVLHYVRAVDPHKSADLASRLETLFKGNGWPPQWRNGIYSYHHYHTQGHEVLGVASGHARVMLGGPAGEIVTINAGDVVVLPAGIGHCLVDASEDYLIVGAYPPGQDADICRDAPTTAMLDRIRTLPFPDSDPVHGTRGALTQLWRW